MDNSIVYSNNNCTCTGTTTSKCVNWSGEKLTSITYNNGDCSFLSLSDIVLTFDSILKQLQDAVLIGSLDKKCLIVDDLNSLGSYIQSLITAYCDLKAAHDQLQKDFDELDIFTKTLNIDLSCITGGNNCGNGNVHTLLSILKTFSKEICSIKKQIN